MESSTVIGTTLPTVMTAAGLPLNTPDWSAVKFLTRPPTLILTFTIDGVASMGVTANHHPPNA